MPTTAKFKVVDNYEMPKRAKAKKSGRRLLYPFDTMKQGQTLVLKTTSKKMAKSAQASAYAYARRAKKRFTCRQVSNAEWAIQRVA